MDNIYDILRKYEFNKTEPETLQELVKSATRKGDSARDELKKLAKASEKLSKALLDANLIFEREIPPVDSPIPPIVGIDGSCQKVGGFGGLWYVPISCAVIKALSGDLTKLEVEVDAGIEELRQKAFQNVGADVERIMMSVETKAIAKWANKAPAESYVLLDGPIIDPPSCKEPEYINLRCAAIQACLAKKILLIGCVKRSFDDQFLKRIISELNSINQNLNAPLSMFPTDTHLLTFVLSYLARKSPGNKYLFVKPLMLAENTVSKLYLQKGLRIAFTYIQHSVGTSLLRAEFVIPEDVIGDQMATYIKPILDVLVGTTYPGSYLPLVVQLAHEKCNIRQGCAEVLYEEIMARSRSADPLEQIVVSKLR